MKIYNKIRDFFKIQFLIIIFSSSLFSSPIHVNINNFVYDYLDRLSVQGVLPDYMHSTLPITRGDVADMLNVLNNNRKYLSMIDQKILDELLADYNYELSKTPYFQLKKNNSTFHPFQSKHKFKQGLRDIFLYKENQEDHHIIVYEDENKLLWFDVGGIARYENDNSDNRLIYSYRYSISTVLNNNISIYGSANLYEYLYNKPNSPMPFEFKGGFPGDIRDGIYGFNKSRAFDYSYGYIHYSSNIGNFIFSIEPLVWGSGIKPVILSDNVNPFPALIWKFKLGKSHFTFMHGSLSGVNNSVLSSEDINYAATYNVGNIEKHIVSHRWEVVLSDRWRAAFTEMLVYGGRRPDPNYLLPATLLWSIQHNTNNYDNILWFVESDIFPLSNVKIYFTLMLDELSLSRVFDDYVNNKWIFQIGGAYKYNLINMPSSINIEFTAARPWVYTHKSPETGSYTHNGRSLGFVYGPNSQVLNVENSLWIDNRNKIEIVFEHLKWGVEPENDLYDEYDFGNNPNHNYHFANPKYVNTTGWLIGDIKLSQSIKFSWGYQMSNIIRLGISLSHKKDIGEALNTGSINVHIDY